MITRSKLAEQLREYQIRSQHSYSPLTFFSPKLYFHSRVDVAVAIGFALLFTMLVVLSAVTSNTGKEEGKKTAIVHMNSFW
ncbi:uncharacterized protein DS421_5g140950 [Arachis hypogaea]|nr:uncharacterized protein DS421_5g140950 [Arachis hypogaea]